MNNGHQAKEKKRRWFSTPYNFIEKLIWFKNYTLGPSKAHKNLTSFLDQSTTLNQISDEVVLGFVGDILPMNGKELVIGEDAIGFFSDADFLIGNFEGTISNASKVFMAQAHTKDIVDILATLFKPGKTVLALANNHAGDFGQEEFFKSAKMLREKGFSLVGTKDDPAILLAPRINVASITNWSNQPCDYIAWFKELEKCYNSEADFNILFAHWGYEHQLYPGPRNIAQGKELLAKWDMIVGHHSHCPQPVTAYDIAGQQRLLAYSLGDFTTGMAMKKFQWGIVLKVSLGPDSKGSWQVGRVQWSFSRVKDTGKNQSKIELADECPYFLD